MKHFIHAGAVLLVAAVLGLAIGADPSSAQQNAPLRVRGTVMRIDGDKLTVKSVDGKILQVNLTPDASVTSIVPARLSDIKPGRFVGTAARPNGDRWTAIEVHVFPVGSKAGEGHRPFAPEPGATMTNADVTAAVVHANRAELTLTTGGQNFAIDVPRGVPVVAMNPGTRKLVARGAFVSFSRVIVDNNSALTASSIAVSKDRRWPPK
jgi:hypothetical protein